VRRVLDFLSEWAARREGQRYVSNRIAHHYREAVGPAGNRWNVPASTGVETQIVHSVEEERRAEVLQYSRFGAYPSHSVLIRMSPGSESRYPND